MAVAYFGKCKNCGATNEAVSQPRCQFCQGDLEHDEKTCECEPCQTKRDIEAGRQGWSLLMQMKRDKQDLKARERQLERNQSQVTCPSCAASQPTTANFCGNCGQKLK
ncbi:MAG TPA: hypothetical protein VI953_01665 [Candidatus Paceibacterota bacterium]